MTTTLDLQQIRSANNGDLPLFAASVVGEGGQEIIEADAPKFPKLMPFEEALDNARFDAEEGVYYVQYFEGHWLRQTPEEFGNFKRQRRNRNPFPQDVTIYSVMAIQAARRASRVGGGYRLYVLAKALDRQGLGNVSRDKLRDYALSLGVSPRQWQRWMDEARRHDLVKDWQTKEGEWMLALPNAGKAAYSMGCESVGNRKATMSARDLIGKGWKARIWAAYEVTHNGRPVSRERMQKIVNVPVSTQRYRDAQAGVDRRQNHAKLKDKADALPMYQDFGKHKGLYIRKDGYIGSRKPDSRYSDIAFRAGKGRARKANATLHRMQRLDGLSLMRQAFSQDVTPETATDQSVFVRLFHSTPKRAEAIDRKLDRSDKRRDFDLFVYSHTSNKGSTIWTQF